MGWLFSLAAIYCAYVIGYREGQLRECRLSYSDISLYAETVDQCNERFKQRGLLP